PHIIWATSTESNMEPQEDIQGMTNKEAIITEQIRRWWVLNWNEVQKIIELSLLKPSLSNKTWKSIAFSSFINLQNFVYKNIVDNIKYKSEDTVWQISES
ncbi:13210_t:CDS:2, partial [Gigaspora rosea]